ncbi:acyl-CoA dehydrogenase family protein [Chryseobacterium terrae]|uniref:Acyl-CoA dehydrogenase n=1 Tax=Chryseobacterium terrae TaxID=3163299 RepID=A0ABW8XZL2_9FLAO
MFTPKEIREKMNGVSEIPQSIIDQIYHERLLQIWVPKMYGGLGLRLKEGLQILFNWSKIDGSLGWMLTLCSGANFFSRNLKPNIAKELFSNSKTCFGGSGMIGGTAEKQLDGTFLINGLWHFATGAPHLSHFTLNAKLTENGNALLDESGNELIRSFVISKNDAEIFPNWKSMGMKATGTYSFKVENVKVTEDYSFIYDEFFTDDVLDRIPFRVFADLTLLVNYLGMASHFSEEAIKIRPHLDLNFFDEKIEEVIAKVIEFANEIEGLLNESEAITQEKQSEIHEYSSNLVNNLSHQILEIYFQLGIKASHTDSAVYQVFCDYFTATQHSNFRRENNYNY